MAGMERLLIRLPADVADIVKEAVAGGEYASSSDVVREALREWTSKRAVQLAENSSLKADIERGLADMAEGRVRDFDATGIVERGRTVSGGRLPSA